MQVYLNDCGTFRKLPIFSANRTEMHRHWHVRVVAIVITGELAERPRPRRGLVATDGLCEQTCPYWAVVESVAVLWGDFEQCRAANNDGQQLRPRDRDEQPPWVEDERVFLTGELWIRNCRRDGDDVI